MASILRILFLVTLLNPVYAHERCSLSNLVEEFGLKNALPAAPNIPEDEARKMRLISLYEPIIVSDAFGYAALIDGRGGKVWVHRYGGFAGVHEWYGPIQVNPSVAERCIQSNSSMNFDGQGRQLS